MFTDEKGWMYYKPIYFVTLVFVLMFGLILYSPNFGDIVDLLIILPLSGIAAIVLCFMRKGKARLVSFAVLALFLLLSWRMLYQHQAVRSEVRWVFESSSWKKRILEEPPRTANGMRCGIWDGWGMFAQDTDVYLIYSPDDALRNYSPTNLGGLPTPVWHVQRLEKNWYSVTFYTNDGWDGCKYFQ